MHGNTVAEEKVKHRVSGPARRVEKGRKVAKVGLEENGWSIKKKGFRPEHVTRCGRETWIICVVHIHNSVKWSKTCDELRSMCMNCLAQQVDIIYGDGHQELYFRTNKHQAERTDSKGNVHPEPLNGLVKLLLALEYQG